MANFSTYIDLFLGFIINLLVYETILFILYVIISVPIMDSDKIEEATREKILDIGALLGFATLIFLMVLFITGSFRLIPV